MPDAAPFLTPWSNFYVMTGSAAAGLTGLMFVVITLASSSQQRSSHDGVSIFNTPTVVHFGAALLVSAILSAPWHELVYPAALLGTGALCGVVYMLVLVLRARRLTRYRPDVEDWVWFTILPSLAYATVLGSAIALPQVSVPALFGVAAGVALLILIGVRNAWDVVTFIAVDDDEDEPPKAPEPKPPEPE